MTRKAKIEALLAQNPNITCTEVMSKIKEKFEPSYFYRVRRDFNQPNLAKEPAIKGKTAIVAPKTNSGITAAIRNLFAERGSQISFGEAKPILAKGGFVPTKDYFNKQKAKFIKGKTITTPSVKPVEASTPNDMVDLESLVTIRKLINKLGYTKLIRALEVFIIG